MDHGIHDPNPSDLGSPLYTWSLNDHLVDGHGQPSIFDSPDLLSSYGSPCGLR